MKCQHGKRQCSVVDTVRELFASGRLRNTEDANAEISTVRDVQALGLNRPGELILSRVVFLRQDVLGFLHELDERLASRI